MKIRLPRIFFLCALHVHFRSANIFRKGCTIFFGLIRVKKNTLFQKYIKTIQFLSQKGAKNTVSFQKDAHTYVKVKIQRQLANSPRITGFLKKISFHKENLNINIETNFVIFFFKQQLQNYG